MMQDDQGMTEEWIVRVQGKEYGPANIETLREWKKEGRLLAENEARNVGTDLWDTAATIPGLFDTGVVVPTAGRLTQTPLRPQHRSFSQVLAETFQIYRTGFVQFFSLALLVFLPSTCAQLITALTQSTKDSGVDLRAAAGGILALLMSILSIVMWPVYVAGIQIITVEIYARRRPGLLAALNEAVKFWPRVAALCIFVYSVFFLLMLFGILIGGIALAGGSSLILILFALALLILQVWMFGRFFVNVLFWQQFAVLENAGFIDSLRESRNLARSGNDLLWFQRPLWRGAFIASLWCAFVLAITLAPEWNMLSHYVSEITTTQDPQALLQKLTEAQQTRGFNAWVFAANVLERILQPLIGIAFVVLYLDSSNQVPSHMKPVVRTGEGDRAR
jgi:hypothetical protein